MLGSSRFMLALLALSVAGLTACRPPPAVVVTLEDATLVRCDSAIGGLSLTLEIDNDEADAIEVVAVELHARVDDDALGGFIDGTVTLAQPTVIAAGARGAVVIDLTDCDEPVAIAWPQHLDVPPTIDVIVRFWHQGGGTDVVGARGTLEVVQMWDNCAEAFGRAPGSGC